jgi:hypothetical protein
MINHIRANKQPLSQRVLQAIADRLEEQDAYLRSALGTLSTQEEQLRGLGSELAESERHRQILTTQNKELLDARKNLEALEVRSGMSEGKRWVKKQFLTAENEPSTSTVVSFYGDIKWDKDATGGNVSFLEISSCHERARLHRTFEMTHTEWVEQVRALRDHVDGYLEFLQSIPEDSPSSNTAIGALHG